MEITEINPNVYADIFGGTAAVAPAKTGGFGYNQMSASTTDTTTIAASTTDTTTIVASTTDTTTTASTTDTTTTVTPDILSTTGQKQTAKTKNSFEDITGYFEDRLKNKRFVALKETNDQGEEVLFVPKTPEEFDEVIDLQVDYKVQQKAKEIEQRWYQSKSPAWQAVAKYADMIDDPTMLVPFLQGIKTIESVKDIDENEIEGAERIIRVRLEQRGDPQKVIDSQIEMLKTSNQLVPTAKEYKPLIINEEAQSLILQRRQAEADEQDSLRSINEIEDAAVKTIEAPIFGKNKLTKEEKAVIYDMIALPTEETQGYGIYAALDKLYDKRDAESMEVLKQVALLLAKKESFFTYFGTSTANSTAANLQKKIKVADSNFSSTSGENDDENPIVTRNKFPRTVRFGSFPQ